MGGFGAMEDQVRRNMEMFERTFAMFAPFARQGGQSGPGAAEAPSEPKPAGGGDDINDLKRQMEEMQKRLDRLGDKEADCQAVIRQARQAGTGSSPVPLSFVPSEETDSSAGTPSLIRSGQALRSGSATNRVVVAGLHPHQHVAAALAAHRPPPCACRRRSPPACRRRRG